MEADELARFLYERITSAQNGQTLIPFPDWDEQAHYNWRPFEKAAEALLKAGAFPAPVADATLPPALFDLEETAVE